MSVRIRESRAPRCRPTGHSTTKRRTTWERVDLFDTPRQVENPPTSLQNSRSGTLFGRLRNRHAFHVVRHRNRAAVDAYERARGSDPTSQLLGPSGDLRGARSHLFPGVHSRFGTGQVNAPCSPASGEATAVRRRTEPPRISTSARPIEPPGHLPKSAEPGPGRPPGRMSTPAPRHPVATKYSETEPCKFYGIVELRRRSHVKSDEPPLFSDGTHASLDRC